MCIRRRILFHACDCNENQNIAVHFPDNEW